MRKPDPIAVATEIVHAWIPAAAQAAAVSLFIATIALGILLVSGHLPELPQ